MKNIIKIEKYKAIISFDADIGLFRGEFIGLNGGADFYADTVDNLYKEGRKSLDEFLAMCKERHINPEKEYSGRFQIRLTSEEHKYIAHKASEKGMSINQFIKDAIL